VYIGTNSEEAGREMYFDFENAFDISALLCENDDPILSNGYFAELWQLTSHFYPIFLVEIVTSFEF
jgi:hypothetical protein